MSQCWGRPAADAGAGWAVVDVETSGLDPTKHRVIEVAVTQLSPAGVVESEWSTLVRARGGTGPVHIHGLTDHDLRDAPTFAEVAGTLRGLLEGVAARQPGVAQPGADGDVLTHPLHW